MVDLGYLKAKLHNVGLIGPLGTWLCNFISNRKQAVKVGGSLSKWVDVKSGVPQGSVMGPIMFLLYIADLGEDLTEEQATILKYIDDTKALRGVLQEEDVLGLQDALEELYTWQRVNNMRWNGTKFQLLRIGPNQDLINNTMLFTENTSDPIDIQETVRDLGVLFDSKANFQPQREAVIGKAKAKASWILRTFRSRDQSLMLKLWKALVQPIMDYCSQLWAPVGLPGPLLRNEGPLRAFTKRIKGLFSYNYWERLKILRIYSIQRRNDRYRVIYTWKILQNLVPNCGLKLAPEAPRWGRKVLIPPIKGSRYAIRTLKDNSFTTEGLGFLTPCLMY